MNDVLYHETKEQQIAEIKKIHLKFNNEINKNTHIHNICVCLYVLVCVFMIYIFVKIKGR